MLGLIRNARNASLQPKPLATRIALTSVDMPDKQEPLNGQYCHPPSQRPTKWGALAACNGSHPISQALMPWPNQRPHTWGRLADCNSKRPISGDLPPLLIHNTVASRSLIFSRLAAVRAP